MQKVKQTAQRYHPGDKVSFFFESEGGRGVVKGEPIWNGYTWMYAFEGTDLRCGEAYLKPEAKLGIDVEATIRTMLNYSFYPIKYDYDSLSVIEKKLWTKKEFEAVVKWIGTPFVTEVG